MGIVRWKTLARAKRLNELQYDMSQAQKSHHFVKWRGIFETFVQKWSATRIEIFNLQKRIEREVLAAHLTGYSTSRSDLLHDLVP